jgi:hypothetical protein
VCRVASPQLISSLALARPLPDRTGRCAAGTLAGAPQGSAQPVACQATERGVRCSCAVYRLCLGPRRQRRAVVTSAISTNHCALSSRHRLGLSLTSTRVCMRWPRGPTLSSLGGPAEVQPFGPLRASLAGELSAASWRPVRSARWPPACMTPAEGLGVLCAPRRCAAGRAALENRRAIAIRPSAKLGWLGKAVFSHCDIYIYNL